jgi:hypothetical protein
MIGYFIHRCLFSTLPRTVALAGLSVAVCFCLAVTVRAETATPIEAELSPRDLHVWGRFDPGTWKRVRIVTDNLSDRGDVADTTTTDTKTTLMRADAKRIALRIEATVDVAGKHFECPPQTVEYGYYGESPDEHAELKMLGSEPLTVDGRQVFCRIQQVVASIGREKQITQMFLSDAVEPYVLKRQTAFLRRDADGEPAADEPQTTTEVIALDVPYRVLHDVKSTAYERTIQRSPRGTNVTLDVTSVDVPGGIVARTSKELDLQGRTLRRSSMELVDYQIADNDDDVPTAGRIADSKVADSKHSGDNDGQYYSRRQARKARKH